MMCVIRVLLECIGESPVCCMPPADLFQKHWVPRGITCPKHLLRSVHYNCPHCHYQQAIILVLYGSVQWDGYVELVMINARHGRHCSIVRYVKMLVH